MGADRLAAPDVTGPAGMARLLERMHHPRSWSLVALEPTAASPVTSCSGRSATTTAPRSRASRIVHVFVDPAWFGHGLAADLLERAVTEMQRQGYRAARLWTPAGQRRARAPARGAGRRRAARCSTRASGSPSWSSAARWERTAAGAGLGEKDIPGTTGFDAVGSLGWLRVEVPEAS